jgi:hypothetical protein
VDEGDGEGDELEDDEDAECCFLLRPKRPRKGRERKLLDARLCACFPFCDASLFGGV